MPGMSKAEARRLTNRIRNNVKDIEEDLQRIMEGEGWVPLDYPSFTAWWDEEIGTLRLGARIKEQVVRHLYLDTYGIDGTEGRIADRVASTTESIHRITDKAGITWRRPPNRRRYDERPKIGTFITREQYQQLTVFRKRKDMTLADTVRLAVAEFLEHHIQAHADAA